MVRDGTDCNAYERGRRKKCRLGTVQCGIGDGQDLVDLVNLQGFAAGCGREENLRNGWEAERVKTSRCAEGHGAI